jgi:transposase
VKSPHIDRTRSPTSLRDSLRDRSSVCAITGSSSKLEVLGGPQGRRCWTASEKLSIVQPAYEADATVSLVARRHGVAPNQLFRWRKLAAQGALIATSAQEEVVAASEYRALQNQIRELQRLLGKKTLEAEILKEALEAATGPRSRCCARYRGSRVVRDERGLRHP